MTESCFFPERRYLHMVLAASREADAASRRRPGSRVKPGPRRWHPGCEAEACDYEGAVTLATQAGLSEKEAVALAEAIWTLGATPVEMSVEPMVSDLGLDPIQQEMLGERVAHLLPASVTATVRGLIGGYASAVHQYHRAPESTRGEWPLFSELIPGLASPLKALRTTPAEYAAARLIAALAKMCGHPVDEFDGALWTRLNADSLVGAGTALRGLASDYRSMQSIEPKIRRRVVLEQETEVEVPAGSERIRVRGTKRTNDPPGRSRRPVDPGAQS